MKGKSRKNGKERVMDERDDESKSQVSFKNKKYRKQKKDSYILV